MRAENVPGDICILSPAAVIYVCNYERRTLNNWAADSVLEGWNQNQKHGIVDCSTPAQFPSIDMQVSSVSLSVCCKCEPSSSGYISPMLMLFTEKCTNLTCKFK